MMKPKATDKKAQSFSPIVIQVIRKSFIIYLISVVVLPVICLIFGFKSLENIGTGLIYGSLCLVLFGVLTFAGNTVPVQLSLPKYNASSDRRHQKADSDVLRSGNEAKRFFFASLISGALLFGTGLFIKIIN